MHRKSFVFDLIRKFRYLLNHYPYKTKRWLWVYKIASEVHDVNLQIAVIVSLSSSNGGKRRYRYLTKEEEKKIIELFLRGYSIYKIAKELDRSTSVVFNVLKRYGLK